MEVSERAEGAYSFFLTSSTNVVALTILLARLVLEALDDGKLGRFFDVLVNDPIYCLLVLFIDGRCFSQLGHHLFLAAGLHLRMANECVHHS